MLKRPPTYKVREKTVELLKDPNLYFREIAFIVGISTQRVSQIYKSSLEKGTSLPIRKVGGKRKKKEKKIYHFKCLTCNKECATPYKNIKHCSKKCGAFKRKKVWPDNLIELYYQSKSVRQLALSLGMKSQSSYLVTKKLLELGISKETIKERDGRKSNRW
jgi:transposase